MGPRGGLDRRGKSRPPPIGIRSPDRPARSESLYRMSYPGLQITITAAAYFGGSRFELRTKQSSVGLPQPI